MRRFESQIVRTVHQGDPGATPWPVDIGGASIDVGGISALANENSIEDTAHDLQAGAYSAATAIGEDFRLGRAEFRFSTTEQRTITITTATGNKIFNCVNDGSLEILIDFEHLPIDAGDNVTIDITSTVGACLVDVLLVTERGGQTLAGAPVLGSGNAVVGQVKITEDGSRVLTLHKEGETVVDLGSGDLTPIGYVPFGIFKGNGKEVLAQQVIRNNGIICLPVADVALQDSVAKLCDRVEMMVLQLAKLTDFDL